MTHAIYMDAEIRPNRSLSQRGFVVLISVITVANVASAAVFLAMGAHWVPVFLGIDVAAVVVAFMASFQAAKRIERVRVTRHAVVVTRETPRFSEVIWESPTAFTRVSVEKDEDEQVVDLRLALSAQATSVAAALSPAERADFARALEDALWRAKRGD
jgi:uncharacterized membrane protein